MFKGVISREEVAPFTRGMSTARWINEVPTELVSIADLWACQDHVYLDALINPSKSASGDWLPHAVTVGPKLVVEDGHHRVLRAALAGKKEIEVRLLRRTTW